MGKKSQENGRKNEKIAEEYLLKIGSFASILNCNDKGFPDLLVLDRDNRLVALFEVKGGEKKTHETHDFQEEMHQLLRSLGLRVGVVIVSKGSVQRVEMAW